MQTGERPDSTRWTASAWIRLSVVLLVGLAVCFPTLLAVALFTFAGARDGWIPSLAAFGGLGFTIGWLAVDRRHRAARRGVAVALAALGGAIGVTVASMAAPTHGRLRHEIEAIALPGWQLEGDREFGNAACFDQCNLVVRTYRVEVDLAAVRADLGPLFEERGCVVAIPDIAPDSWSCDEDRRTDIEMSFDLRADPSGGTVVEVRAEAK